MESSVLGYRLTFLLAMRSITAADILMVAPIRAGCFANTVLMFSELASTLMILTFLRIPTSKPSSLHFSFLWREGYYLYAEFTRQWQPLID